MRRINPAGLPPGMLSPVLDSQLARLCSFARAIGLEERAIVLYEEEVRRLNSGAKVTAYIGLLAEKRTRERLREATPSQ